MDQHETRAAHWLHQRLVSQRLKSKKFVIELLLLNFTQCSWRLDEVICFISRFKTRVGRCLFRFPHRTYSIVWCGHRLATGIDWFCYQQTMHIHNKIHEFGCVFAKHWRFQFSLMEKLSVRFARKLMTHFILFWRDCQHFIFHLTFSITNDVHASTIFGTIKNFARLDSRQFKHFPLSRENATIKNAKSIICILQ